MTKVGLIQFILLFVISSAFGQKVKYKDIYALLSTKQFEQAEPFLKSYLRENQDNPNAFLFMGNIYQEKSAKNDILKQTKLALSNMDSAILYYDRANKLIDDREVRRNKEYYQSYNRRDLRTGEFGVKMSDIQFDIEKRIEGLKERIDRVKMVKHFFVLADSTYKKAHATFATLQKTYPGERQLYLQADENLVKTLSMLTNRFDSCMKAFDQYKSSANLLGKIGYNQTLSVSEISNFSNDGTTSADFYADQPMVWNYKKFADEAKQTVEAEIFPMRQHLITYDIEINKLREKIKSDSVSVRNDLTKLIDKLLYDQLKKFDPEPLPMAVFSLKTAELEYRSLLLEHRSLKDSSDIHLQIAMLNKEIALLGKLDSVATKLSDEQLEAKAIDYTHFINNTYSNTTVLKSYVHSLKEFGLREQKIRDALLEKRKTSLHYIVDGADSIPLLAEIASVYKPLLTTPEKFTIGLCFRDTLHVQGYFYTVTAARKPDVKALFTVDKASFRPGHFSGTKALTYSDPGGQIYYVLVYSERATKEKFPATLAKIYRSDGLAWSMDYPLSFVPGELMLRPDTGELIIKDNVTQLVVDKNGKVVK
ncbi:MAG: hypothetical protein ABIR06_17110 [Cyclobacteriaceae bacterium]